MTSGPGDKHARPIVHVHATNSSSGVHLVAGTLCRISSQGGVERLVLDDIFNDAVSVAVQYRLDTKTWHARLSGSALTISDGFGLTVRIVRYQMPVEAGVGDSSSSDLAARETAYFVVDRVTWANATHQSQRVGHKDGPPFRLEAGAVLQAISLRNARTELVQVVYDCARDANDTTADFDKILETIQSADATKYMGGSLAFVFVASLPTAACVVDAERCRPYLDTEWYTYTAVPEEEATTGVEDDRNTTHNLGPGLRNQFAEAADTSHASLLARKIQLSRSESGYAQHKVDKLVRVQLRHRGAVCFLVHSGGYDNNGGALGVSKVLAPMAISRSHHCYARSNCLAKRIGSTAFNLPVKVCPHNGINIWGAAASALRDTIQEEEIRSKWMNRYTTTQDAVSSTIIPYTVESMRVELLSAATTSAGDGSKRDSSYTSINILTSSTFAVQRFCAQLLGSKWDDEATDTVALKTARELLETAVGEIVYLQDCFRRQDLYWKEAHGMQALSTRGVRQKLSDFQSALRLQPRLSFMFLPHLRVLEGTWAYVEWNTEGKTTASIVESIVRQCVNVPIEAKSVAKHLPVSPAPDSLRFVDAAALRREDPAGTETWSNADVWDRMASVDLDAMDLEQDGGMAVDKTDATKGGHANYWLDQRIAAALAGRFAHLVEGRQKQPDIEHRPEYAEYPRHSCPSTNTGHRHCACHLVGEC